MAACIAVTSLSLVPLASQVSGATDSAAGSLTSPRQARESTASPRVAPEKCPSARHGLRFYQQRYSYWRSRAQRGSAVLVTHSGSCVRVRRLAELWRGKARTARRSFLAWHREQFEWWLWLPDKFARVGACETGYGRKPGRWDWDSGTYVSAFGIYRAAYAQFARATGTPTWDEPGARTPREQFIVASAIQARYGWSAWGCGGA